MTTGTVTWTVHDFKGLDQTLNAYHSSPWLKAGAAEWQCSLYAGGFYDELANEGSEPGWVAFFFESRKNESNHAWYDVVVYGEDASKNVTRVGHRNIAVRDFRGVAHGWHNFWDRRTLLPYSQLTFVICVHFVLERSVRLSGLRKCIWDLWKAPVPAVPRFVLFLISSSCFRKTEG